MVLPLDIHIKQEKEDEDYNQQPTWSSNYEMEVKVKVENSQIKDEDPGWSVQNSSLQDVDVVHYEDLIVCDRQQCDICLKTYDNRYNLLRHKLVHLELKLLPLTKDKYQCYQCFEFFTNKHELLKHLKEKQHENKKSLSVRDTFYKKSNSLQQCRYCSKIMPYKTWNEHERMVHGDRIHECIKCNIKYKSQRYLRRHMKNVHDRVTRNKKLDDFNDNELKVVAVKCHLCPSILTSNSALKTHIRNCHCETEKCNICGSVLKKSYLQNHIRRVHYDDGKVYSCKCGKSFKSPRYLKVHIKNAKRSKHGPLDE